MNQLLKGDCLDLMKTLADNSVDAIVTDPPYGLEFMGKEWDKGVPALEFWVEMLRILKPGGHLLSFSGTRTYHRMAVNIEDAGFEIRDMIEWVYGSGFPKSLNIGKAIDKLQGAERETIKYPARPETSGTMSGSSDTRPWIEESRKKGYHEVAGNIPVTEEAKQWEGWGTALKPAHEPICMARKPLEKGLTVAENCLKWGTGGINIDESRVEGTQEYLDRKENPIQKQSGDVYGFAKYDKLHTRAEPNNQGRFPANLILSWKEDEYMLKLDVSIEDLIKLKQYYERPQNL